MKINSQTTNRTFSLDLLRVIAIFLVIYAHSGYLFFNSKVLVVTDMDRLWLMILTVIGRTSVPLFVMLSGYFLLPMKDSTSVFIKKRFLRLLPPFLIWSLVFAFYPVLLGACSFIEAAKVAVLIPVQYESYHFWYIYMILGLYLLIPIISPWLNKCSKKELQFYLFLWGVSTFSPYIHQKLPYFLGEAPWNETGSLYYFSGFIGYLMAGYYIKRYGTFSKISSISMILVGYITTVISCFHYSTPNFDLIDMQLSIWLCNSNVALMTLGLFSLFAGLQINNKGFKGNLVTDISLKSYGMYLFFPLTIFVSSRLFRNLPSALVSFSLIAICSFTISYFVVKILSYIPKSKYFIG